VLGLAAGAVVLADPAAAATASTPAGGVQRAADREPVASAELLAAAGEQRAELGDDLPLGVGLSATRFPIIRSLSARALSLSPSSFFFTASWRARWGGNG
jgi:hypothetical protein